MKKFSRGAVIFLIANEIRGLIFSAIILFNFYPG